MFFSELAVRRLMLGGLIVGRIAVFAFATGKLGAILAKVLVVVTVTVCAEGTVNFVEESAVLLPAAEDASATGEATAGIKSKAVLAGAPGLTEETAILLLPIDGGGATGEGAAVIESEIALVEFIAAIAGILEADSRPIRAFTFGIATLPAIVRAVIVTVIIPMPIFVAMSAIIVIPSSELTLVAILANKLITVS